MEAKNEFRIEGDMVWVKLTQGQETCVDLADWPAVSQYRWCAEKVRKAFYVRGRVGGEYIQLHKFLFPDADEVDHRDLDGLNNRRIENLRPATRSQNASNRKQPSHNSSGFKGVSWDKARKIWFVEIMAKGKRVFLGRFENKIRAAESYNAGAQKYHGEFARLNPV